VTGQFNSKLGISIQKGAPNQQVNVARAWKVGGVWNVGPIGKPTNIPEKSSNALRFVCMSDTHNYHNEHQIPAGDFFLHAGDWSDDGNQKEVDSFVQFLDKLPHKYKIVIAGNHEATFDEQYYLLTYGELPIFQKNFKEFKTAIKNVCIYLENEHVTIEDVNIYGSPHTLMAGWAFGLLENNRDEVNEAWSLIPSGIHVLITHTPPAVDTGCKGLLEHVKRVQPTVHLFGHIHEGYGVYKTDQTIYINAANNNVNSPIVFDLVHE